MKSLSAVIIAKNEQKNITACVKSITCADEILLVVDTDNSDDTLNLAKSLNVNVYQLPFEGFGRLRNKSIALAKGDYILFVDADERLTKELNEEIKDLLSKRDDLLKDGYYIKRKNFFLGKLMRFGPFGRDYQLKLFKKGKAYCNDNTSVHEKLYIETGKIGYLKNSILHYPYKNLDEYLEKLKRYSSLAALDLYKNNKRCNLLRDLLLRPLACFFKMYILKLGFLEGFYGLILSILSAFHLFLKYLRLYYLYK
jgi:glycosyltransferase involved in cell wall biosynthesis